ncbi:MAG: hypothetical protein M3314_06935 [Actinomycetota bacterium]|nr:hypothetical protein [Actinomycetota bacterium]
MEAEGRAEAAAPCVVDLYLGGDLGQWVLGQLGPARVLTVFTLDDEITEAADRLGLDRRRDPPDPDDVANGAVAFCVHYPKIFPSALIARYRRMYNLHPGYLPWGRGFYPVFWALWEQTPAGATLHEITEGLDKGPVVKQVRVAYGPADTGASLHRRVREAERQIFQEVWPRIAGGELPPARPPSTEEAGSYHAKAEFHTLREQADISVMTVPDLLRLVRSFTFPGFPGLVVRLGDRRFELRLEERPGDVTARGRSAAARTAECGGVDLPCRSERGDPTVPQAL